ncbi:M1 family metallopeptidase [Hymenobacter mucosus]|nr:M1 family metallopeptidase [Hymenobacter mucosus]
MRQVFMFAAGLLLALVYKQAPAQIPAYRARPADVNGSVAELCARVRTAGAERPGFATVSHRQKMARYDVSYYKLNISLENNSRSVSGVVTIRSRALVSNLDSVAFELYPALVIDSVVVDGQRSPGWRRQEGDVTVGLRRAVAANTLFSTLVYYHGTAPNGSAAAIGNALDTGVDPNFGVSCTWSLSEPYHAYEWWPCKQVLTDKADSSDVWVTTTALNKVGSNGILARTVALPNGKVRYEWKSRKPIDYYLISVAVAPYTEYVNYANPAGGPRIPIVNYVYNQDALAFYRTEIDRTPGFIDYYSSLVGLYPFATEKYGHAMAPIGGGVEHQTMTTQSEFNFTLTAHELFHQWFGDNVTCGAWEDIWLNEGFASYGEYLALNRFSGASAAQQWMDNAHFVSMNIRNASTGVWETAPGGSIRVSDTTSVGRIFSSRLSYKKGAAVVHMLRYLLNDDTKFFRALTTYQNTYAGRTARTADLQRIFEAEAGRSLQYFFDQWYRGEGFPTFAVRWNQVGSSIYLQTTETPSMPSVTPLFDTELDYRFTFTDGTTRTVRQRQSQLVASFGLTDARTVSSITIDPDQWVLNGTAGTVERDNALVLATRQAAASVPITVFPNPCRNQLRLADFTAARAHAEVRDALGRIVLRQAVTSTAPLLDTRHLAPGWYHLRLITPDGNVSQARFIRAAE